MLIKNLLFVLIQYLLPHHLLSRVIGKLADSEISFIKKTFIEFFMKRFQIDLQEAVRENPENYKNFNDFFTRQLKPNVRPIAAEEEVWVSPVDGAVSQAGTINDGRLLQAKGKSFTLAHLLGGDKARAKAYANGHFATLYLSPRDYHRIHIPVSAKLLSTTFIPGRLFSVNDTTAKQVSNLFAKNERLVCEFESDAGKFILVLVGAMIVASIETSWAGVVAPIRRQIKQQQFGVAPPSFSKGEEIAQFKLGSTVILITPENLITPEESLTEGATVKMGQGIARTIKPTPAPAAR